MTEAVKKNTGRTIQAVFWDIDGTLIDSEELHYQVIADWCRDRGYILKKEDNEQLLGKSMLEKWQHLSSVYDFKADATLFSSECAEMYCNALTPALKRKAPDIVFRKISALAITQACVSNGDRAVVEANLKILDLEDLVRFSISGEDVTHGKPDPEPYILAAAKLNVKPQNCIAVEDSTVGVRSALAAGMTVIAWPEEGSSRAGYEKADYFIATPADFPWQLLNN
jgi:beta-phosphoglucomutase-like phosphatase (HAD superfamily)